MPPLPGRLLARTAAPADRVHHAGRRRHGRAHAERDGRAGARGHPRVRARQPPARLPGLRQGRRVPAAGLHVPARLPDEPDRRPAPAFQKADPALREHRARPRALRPLLPLHALLRRGRLGAGADRRAARRPIVHHEPVRPAAAVELQRQHHRPLPGGRPDLARVALRVATVGHDPHRERVQQVRGRLQHDDVAATRPARADHLARERRHRRGLDLRSGPLRLHRRQRPRRASARPLRARRQVDLGRRALRRRGRDQGQGCEARHLASRRPDQRGGVPLPPPARRPAEGREGQDARPDGDPRARRPDHAHQGDR